MKQTITYCDSCKKMILGEVHTMIPHYRKDKAGPDLVGRYHERYIVYHNNYQELCDECFEKRKAKVIEIINSIEINDTLLHLIEAWILDNKNEEIGKLMELQRAKEAEP